MIISLAVFTNMQQFHHLKKSAYASKYVIIRFISEEVLAKSFEFKYNKMEE